MDALTLDPRTTALVLIDLQRGIVARQTAPHTSRDVVARARRLAERVRAVGGTVVLVHVAYSKDGRDRAVTLRPGEILVVPRGVEHRTVAEREASALLFEPAGTRNTGDVLDPRFTAPGGGAP